MSIIICKKHNRQAGEKISKLLFEKYESNIDISNSIRNFSFTLEDYECQFFGLEEEIESIEEEFSNGKFLIKSDENLNKKLGRITIMCLVCLKDALKGKPFPSN